MKKEIIDKFGLVETDFTIGKSFRNGIKIYILPNSDLLLSDCDSEGNPHPAGMILMFRYNSRKYIYVTPEILLNNPFL